MAGQLGRTSDSRCCRYSHRFNMRDSFFDLARVLDERVENFFSTSFLLIPPSNVDSEAVSSAPPSSSSSPSFARASDAVKNRNAATFTLSDDDIQADATALTSLACVHTFFLYNASKTPNDFSLMVSDSCVNIERVSSKSCRLHLPFNPCR